jgi:[ribosomal protein S5]-alanine N-acetyltransferase
MRLNTGRLTLIPIDLDVAIAAMFNNHAEVERLLSVRVHAAWFSADMRELFPAYVKRLQVDPANLTWGAWALIHTADQVVVGDLGFWGMPNQEGVTEIYYEIVAEYRNHGYATEAVKALVDWAIAQPQVTRIFAQCHVANVASIRILETIGMQKLWQNGDRWQWQLKNIN